MIFLLWYMKPTGRIVRLEKFSAADKSVAEELMHGIEMSLQRNKIEDHEVILLDGENEEAIKFTHGRYFYDAGDLMKRASDLLS